MSQMNPIPVSVPPELQEDTLELKLIEDDPPQTQTQQAAQPPVQPQLKQVPPLAAQTQVPVQVPVHTQASQPQVPTLTPQQIAQMQRPAQNAPVQETPVPAGVPNTLPQTQRPKREAAAPEKQGEAEIVNVQLPFWVLNTVMVGTAIVVILWIAAFIRSENLAAMHATRVDKLNTQLSEQLTKLKQSYTRQIPAVQSVKQVTGGRQKNAANINQLPDHATPLLILGEAEMAIKTGQLKAATIAVIQILKHPKATENELKQSLLIAKEKLMNPVLAENLASRLLALKQRSTLATAMAIELKSSKLSSRETAQHVAKFTKVLSSLHSGEKETLIKTIANIYLARQEYLAMQGSMKQLAKSHPESVAALRNLAIANHALSAKTPSLLHEEDMRPDFLLDKAIQISPQDDTLWYDLARYHWQSGHDISAAKAIERAIQLNPRNKLYHIISADIYQAMGKQDKANWRLEMARDS